MGVLSVGSLPEKPTMGIVSARELGLSAGQFVIQPKMHAILEVLPHVFDGTLWDGCIPVLTLPGGARAPTGPFCCTYIAGGHAGAALTCVTLIAAMKKHFDTNFQFPEKLLDTASNISAKLVEIPDTWLDGCIHANRIGMSAARAAQIGRPGLWDLRAQVTAGKGGFTIEEQRAGYKIR
jgi:hypothetical protein